MIFIKPRRSFWTLCDTNVKTILVKTRKPFSCLALSDGIIPIHGANVSGCLRCFRSSIELKDKKKSKMFQFPHLALHFLASMVPLTVFKWQLHYVNSSTTIEVHCCGTSGSMHACHEVGLGSIPIRDKLPGWGCFGVFPHLQMSGSFRPQGPRISFGHQYHPESFIKGVNDLRCWHALKPPIYLHTYNNWTSNKKWQSINKTIATGIPTHKTK